VIDHGAARNRSAGSFALNFQLNALDRLIYPNPRAARMRPQARSAKSDFS
jgi:hypothetical protein